MLFLSSFVGTFYAENEADLFGVTAISRRAAVARVPKLRPPYVPNRCLLDMKRSSKEASFPVRHSSSERASKTVQDRLVGLRIWASFRVFFLSDVSDQDASEQAD